MIFSIALTLLSVNGALAAITDCNASNCVMPACLCPSTNPPGGLASANIPQLITLTLDDAINFINFGVIRSVMDGVVNPNNCPLSATFFVSLTYTDYSLVQQASNLGHEIAAHTINHLNDGSSYAEITGSRAALSAFGGVPSSQIVGFRTPYLNYNPQTFKSLRGSGQFFYESSMSISPNGATWPYTLDFGPATPCQTGTCDPNMQIPGLWEIPMPNMLNTDESINTSMDPDVAPGQTTITAASLTAMWQYNFDKSYNGKRTPFGIFLHVLWIQTDIPTRVQALKDFIKYTQTKPNVYWVNNQQLLAWMANPTDVVGSLTNPALGCNKQPVNSGVCDGLSGAPNSPNACVWATGANTYNGYYNTSTCSTCPSRPPNITDIAPFKGGAVPESSTTFIPAAGCPYPQIWSAKTATCITTTRATSTAPDAKRSFVIGAPIASWIPVSAGGSDATGSAGGAGAGGAGAGGKGSSSPGWALTVSLLVVSACGVFVYLS